ncbi:phosphate ABC transporter substrate-binding protein PstS [Fluviibacter phosphoraccumulans]|jgi:phosphate transport system substrate-binding protein|uniref:Phosphate-binding protein PstS n=1 Tax=Fluviibacter phosphoraccumulans TaxID=1751046 RepID=A0A679HUD6_9RHOO|nr:phosphate ABC transporter substrate-binding protein PstS [Fluviibacter phosphoraccumulans]BBU68574.1 phosphate-binding protein PstS [Fluviibacter phosphoraccumulans]BBU72271.1 phosphate-binding protein PstS [Fluviibacter phosphoraccumulans]BCA64487.1 phosphate-binding protein PstS [Fluviibacter phosphoraccumulans]
MNVSVNKLVAGLLVSAGLVAGANAAQLTGAGATFPAPMYAKWAEAYKAQTGTTMNYQAIGSGGGVKQIMAKTVDFGASDDPVPAADLEKNGLAQFPAIIGGVVPVANIPGIAPGQLKLNNDVLSDIFRAKVTKWNDPAIASVNPGIKLPDTAITVVYRSDSSGTTAVFTDFLAQVSSGFKGVVGSGKTVNWPAGVGGKGNAGVAANVTKIDGAIGYVEYAYAKQNKMTHLSLINKDGKAVQPNEASFSAAAAKANWAGTPNFAVNLNNQPGAGSWPITSASFILMYKKAEKPEQSAEVLKFFNWALTKGQKMATDLDYVPLPDNAVKAIVKSWADIKSPDGKPVFVAK